MKHTIEELQFASTVREIARTLQATAEKSEPRLHLELEERSAAHQAWLASNPLRNFIAPALIELEATAKEIADILATR